MGQGGGLSFVAPPRGALESKYVWLVSSTWMVLHYIPSIDDDKGATSGWEWWDTYWDPPEEHTVTSICGVVSDFQLPGFFSRMGAPRCKRCCRMLGIPEGNGAPSNETAST